MDHHRTRLAAVPLLLVLLGLGACSSQGGDGGNASGGGSLTGVPAAEAEPEEAADGTALSGSTDSRSTLVAGAEGAPEEADRPAERAVISTGVVSLRDDDVAGARFDVQKIVDTHRGEVAEEKTRTDDDGEISQSRLVVRVPAREFDATMEELEQVAELESSNRSSEDVTTAVIDNEVRIRAQTESLLRIEALLARASSIRDIVAIEAQLTRRQAELDSLKQQQAYLADQTSMSTISVFLEARPEREEEREEDAAGFLAGLGSGWDALSTLATGAATAAGAVLPFAGLVLLVGVPVWLVLRRRLSAGRTGRTPSAA